jgi:diguanylate cyclase (GGDEF)-like protein/PAS domain S-box-containing protein
MPSDQSTFLPDPRQMLDLITRNSLDAFIVSDTDNTVIVWSEYAETLFGWTASEAVGAQLTTLIIPPEHRHAHEEGIRRFLETGAVKNVNTRLELFGMHKDGRLLPLEMTVIPVQLDGRTLFTSSIRDNAERHLQKQLLEQQAALLDLSRDAIVVTNLDDEIEFWSSGAALLFQYTAGEATGRRYHDLLHASGALGLERLAPLLKAAGHWESETICRKRDDTVVPVLSRYALEQGHGGNPSRILISSTDISLRKEMQLQEALLAESEQRFHSLFEQHPDGVIHFDGSMRLSSVNAAFAAMSGYSHAEVLSLDRPYLVVPEHIPMLMAALQSALGGTPQTLDTTLLRKNTSRLEVSLVLVPNVANGKIIGVYGIVKDNSVHMNHERQIHHMATHDALTGLPNRYFLEDRLHHAIDQARRNKAMVGVLFLDLNRFKVINDSLGHDRGDSLLGVVAERLQGAVREADTVARIGGDEFVVVLENIQDPGHVRNVATHILESIAAPIHVAGHHLSVTTSIGISFYPDGGSDTATLLKQADLAMYEAKGTGHGVYREYHAGMGAKAASRLVDETALRHAINNDELVLHYQPRISLATGTVTSVEALVRWNHPTQGLLLPHEFLPMAEEMGIIDMLGVWVVVHACQQLAEWHARQTGLVSMSINISAHQLQTPLLYKALTQALSACPFPPEALELEITESAFMQDKEAAHAMLTKIADLGLRLSVDDFGTGYSSLSLLKALPLDTLKIDQSFMQNLTEDSSNAAIVAATIAMAQKIGLTVVAEGVTAVEQLKFLHEHHCDQVQGYLFGQPCPAAEFESILQRYWKAPLIRFAGQSIAGLGAEGDGYKD